jgi:hypothetical protein
LKSVSELITDIAQVASLPLEESDRWSRADVVQAMNLAMDEKVVPELLQFNNEHLVVRQTYPLSAANYPTMQIPVPRRAYGRQLREIKYLPAGQTSMLREINLTQTTLPEKDQVYGPSYTFGMPYSFYFQNDTVNLLTDPASATGTLVFYYFLTPSTLVDKTTEYANVTNVAYDSGTSTFTFTVTSAGAEFDTYAGSNGTVKLYDVYRRSTGVIIYRDLPLTKATGTFTVVGNIGADDAGVIRSYQESGMPVVAPYTADIILLPTGQSQFSTLPSEFDTLLVYHTVSRILESLGDTEGLQINEQRVKNAYSMISHVMGASRVKGEPKVIVNRRGLGDVQRWSWWRGRWWR